MSIACDRAIASAPAHFHGVIALGPSMRTAGLAPCSAAHLSKVAPPIGVPTLARAACTRDIRDMLGRGSRPDFVQVWGQRARTLGSRLADLRTRLCVVNDHSGDVDERVNASWSTLGVAEVDATSTSASPRPRRSFELAPPIIGLAHDLPTPEDVDGICALLSMLSTAGIHATALLGADAPHLNRIRRHAGAHPVADVRITNAGFTTRSLKCDLLLAGIRRRPADPATAPAAQANSFTNRYGIRWAAEAGIPIIATAEAAPWPNQPGVHRCSSSRPSEFARITAEWIEGRTSQADSTGNDSITQSSPTPKGTRPLNELVQLAWWRALNGRA